MLGPVVLFVTLIGLVSSANPGVKVRVTQKGVDYASSVAQSFLAKELRALHVPNQGGKSGKVHWSVYNIQNRGVTPPTTRISFDPAHNAIKLSLSGLSVSLRARWNVKFRVLFKISLRGGVDLRVSRVNAAVSIRLGVGRDGRPSLSTATCTASIGDVHIHFRGLLGWIINLVKRPFERKVKGLLQGQICKVVKKFIDQKGNKEMEKLKVSVGIAKRFTLDYGLSASPVVANNYLDVLSKGQVSWRGDTSPAPYSPAPIPASSDVSRMLYLWVTDYSAKTILHSAQKHNFLKLDVGKNNLPGRNSTFLDTTCSFLCIGTILTKVGQQYPNRQVKLVISSTKVPDFSITPSGISLGLNTHIDMSAGSAQFLTLSMALAVKVQGEIKNERLVGKIVSHSFNLGVEKSQVGELPISALNQALGGILDLVVMPEMNRIAAIGVDLPVTTGDVKFTNPSLRLLPGSLMIATDVAYRP